MSHQRPFRITIVIATAMPPIAFLFMLLRGVLPADASEIFLAVGRMAFTALPVGVLFHLTGRAEIGPLDPLAPWFAYGAILCLAMTVAILFGGFGYLLGRGGATSQALPLQSLAAPPAVPLTAPPTGLLIASGADSVLPQPRRGAAFLFPWLLWMLVAPTLVAMLGVSGPFGPDTPSGFALGFAGLMALAAATIAWVVGRQSLAGRPGYGFKELAGHFQVGRHD